MCGAPVTGPTNLDRYVHAAEFFPYIIDGPLLASVFQVRQHVVSAPSVCMFCFPYLLSVISGGRKSLKDAS